MLGARLHVVSQALIIFGNIVGDVVGNNVLYSITQFDILEEQQSYNPSVRGQVFDGLQIYIT
tara:strand:+ start:170 stop:355 length:186 start_codon:yes stop_codon:yes gene_type:complete